MTADQMQKMADAKATEMKDGSFQKRVEKHVAAGHSPDLAPSMASTEIDLEILNGTGKYARAADAGIFPSLSDGEASHARAFPLPK